MKWGEARYPLVTTNAVRGKKGLCNTVCTVFAQSTPGKENMPLTPLHLAAGLPFRQWASIKAFIWVNLLIDLEPVLIIFFGMDRIGYPIHYGIHTGIGMLLVASVVILCGMFSSGRVPWIYGSLLGAASHLILDMLVHSDVWPLAPWIQGNPFYLDLYHEVSITCAVVLVYYLARWVESLRIGEVGTRTFRRCRRKLFPGTTGE